MDEQRRIRVYQIDVFAERLFEGNPACVVPDAEGLTDEEMQRITGEVGNSETVFLLAPRSHDHDVWARFFTPTSEVPLCGHATLAGQTVFAREREAAGGPGIATPVRQGSAGGIWTVVVGEDGSSAEMLQEPVTSEGSLAPELEAGLLEALGIGRETVDPRCPIEIHSTGHPKVMVGLSRKVDLDGLEPDLRGLAALTRKIGVDGYFLFTLDTDRADLTTDCRMFAPGVGVPEDPVTGSGQGPLGAYLVRYGLVPVDGDRVSFLSRQGRVMGRPGIASVTVELENGVPRRVRVGGRIRVVFETEIDLKIGAVPFRGDSPGVGAAAEVP